MNLDDFNQAAWSELRPALLACCDVPAWTDSLLAGRPFADVAALEEAADRASRALTPGDVERALAAHPRIGERAAGRGTEATWSQGEQASVSRDEATRAALLEGNRDYEERFGRVFLICVSDRSGEEILSALRERLGHDDETEAAVVADELRMIALLRLRKVIA